MAFQVALILAVPADVPALGLHLPDPNMPGPIQVVTYIIPARYFLVALRGIVLKGVGLGTIWVQLVALVVYAVAVARARLGQARAGARVGERRCAG